MKFFLLKAVKHIRENLSSTPLAAMEPDILQNKSYRLNNKHF